MTENQFDDHFRNRLENYSSQVPEDMWEKVRPKKDKDRKGFFFWLRYVILPVCILAGLAAIYYITSRPSLKSPVSPPTSVSPVPSISAHPSTAFHSSRTAALYPDSTALLSNLSVSPFGRPSTHPHPSPASHASTDSATMHPQPGLPGLQPIPHTLGRVTARILSQKPAAPNQKDSPVNHHDWYLDGFASPDWPFATGKILNQKMALSYTAGLTLTRSFGQHFSGTIGVQYSRINSHLSIQDTLGAFDTVHFKSSAIDVPLLFGYRISTPHISMAVNTGIIFNIYSYGDLYKKNTGFSLYLGLNFAEKISDRLSLFAEPYYRYRLTNMSDSFKQKVNIAGLSAGLRYHFKKLKKHK